MISGQSLRLSAERRNGGAPRRGGQLLVHGSLKKEDKGRPDPSRRRSKKKFRRRRPRRPKRPDEINPFKETYANETTALIPYEKSFQPLREEPGDDGEDPEVGEGYYEMMKRLETLELEYGNSEDDEDESLKEEETDPEVASLNNDLGQLFEDNADDLLDFEADQKPFRPEEAFQYNLDEKESQQFLRDIAEIDPDDFFQENQDVIKEVEEAIVARRTGAAGAPANTNDKEAHRWEHPYDQLCWDLMHLFFPKRGKKKYRQNWDHMNVSEEVKQKRAAKKARGYSIWLSMENAKILKRADVRLRRTPRDAAEREDIVRDALHRYAVVLKFQERKFNAQNAVGVLHAAARLVCQAPDPSRLLRWHAPLFIWLFQFVDTQLETLTGRAVCELLWTLDRLGPDALEILHSANGMSDWTLPDQSTLQRGLLKRGKQVAATFNAQDIAILIHTLVKSDQAVGEVDLIERLLKEAVKKAEQFRPLDIAMLLWCLPQLKTELPLDLVPFLVKGAVDQASAFSPRAVATTVYSLARLRYVHCTRLCAIFEKEVLRRLETFKTQEIANVLWGYARLRYLPSPRFLNTVAAAARARMQEFSPQSAVNLMLSYAMLGSKDAALAAAVRARLVFEEKALTTQDVVNAAWAFAILEFLDPPFMRFCIENVKSRIDRLPVEERVQLYQCLIHCSVYFPKSNVFQLLSPAFVESCRHAWVEAQRCGRRSGALVEVAEFLKSEKYVCTESQSVQGGTFVVDAVTKNGVNYALECLSQDVRFRNQPNALVGKLVWRENVLLHFGYFLLRIDPVQWKTLETDEQRREFFKRIL